MESSGKEICLPDPVYMADAASSMWSDDVHESEISFIPGTETEALRGQWARFAQRAVRKRQPLLSMPDGRTNKLLAYAHEVPVSSLQATGIDICTTGCDFSCAFCFEGADFLRTLNPLSLEDTGHILETITSPGSHIEEATCFGGEFARQPHAKEILLMIARTPAASGEPLRARMVTHGGKAAQALLADTEVAGALHRVAISREAADPKLNDRMRGKDATARFNAAVGIALSQGITTEMNVTVWRKNVDQVADLIRLAHNLRLRRVNIHGLGLTGNAAVRLQPSDVLSPVEWRELVIRQVVAGVGELAATGSSLEVDVEAMHPDTSPFTNFENDTFSCAVQKTANLELIQPQSPRSRVWELLLCNLYFGSSLSGYLLDLSGKRGVIYERAGRSELTDTADCSQGCPVRLDPATTEKAPCIYDRLAGDTHRFRMLRFTPGAVYAGQRARLADPRAIA